MTRPELRVFLQEWFCGCGSPASAARCLYDLLMMHPLHQHRAAFEARVPDEGMQYLLLYTLDHFGLAEHGGSVGGQWLTDKGTAVLEALQREAGDNFETLCVPHCCIHGQSIDDDCADCSSATEKKKS